MLAEFFSPLGLGGAVFLVFMFAIGIWMSRAQDAYLHVYAAATGSFAPTSRELAGMLLRPWRLLTTAPLTHIMNATATRQRDAGLEALRQRYLSRRRIAFLALFAGFFILAAIDHH